MKVQSVVIINKSGGLIYCKTFPISNNDNNDNKIDINEMLVFAGTFHGTYAIASQLTPRSIQIEQQQQQSATLQPMALPKLMSSSFNSSVSTLKNANQVLKGGTYKVPDFINPRIINNTNKTGIKSISTDKFDIHCFQTLTGVKFLIFADTSSKSSLSSAPAQSVSSTSMLADSILKRVYCLYGDYVMKNPFYSTEMPIKNTLFDSKLQLLLDSV
ncbi:hypothetical protein ACO0QE_002574 [Hanseniaspora vineae]